MKLTNIIRTLCLGAALSSTALFANTVKMTDTPYDGIVDQGGGEFKAQITGGPTFYTFCLENFIHVSLPGTYEYTISERAFSGGKDFHDIAGNPAGDPLSKGTAYLYEQFFKGTLVGALGGNYNDDRDYNAGLLQRAIWTLEDEYNYGNNFYLTLVKNMFGNTGAFETVGADSKVKVMNLWGINDRKDVQSMLIYVPDSGMTAVLLGLGLLSLAAVRRKL
jgi:hypothetical protein